MSQFEWIQLLNPELVIEIHPRSQVPRISTGQALARGIVKEGLSTMPTPSLRAEPLAAVSAAKRRAVSKKTGASACARSPWMRWSNKPQRHAYVC